MSIDFLNNGDVNIIKMNQELVLQHQPIYPMFNQQVLGVSNQPNITQSNRIEFQDVETTLNNLNFFSTDTTNIQKTKTYKQNATFINSTYMAQYSLVSPDFVDYDERNRVLVTSQIVNQFNIIYDKFLFSANDKVGNFGLKNPAFITDSTVANLDTVDSINDLISDMKTNISVRTNAPFGNIFFFFVGSAVSKFLGRVAGSSSTVAERLSIPATNYMQVAPYVADIKNDVDKNGFLVAVDMSRILFKCGTYPQIYKIVDGVTNQEIYAVASSCGIELLMDGVIDTRFVKVTL